MGRVRGVTPRNACDPGSRSPAYASSSVRRSVTPPPVRRQPKRSGATSTEERAKKSRGRRLSSVLTDDTLAAPSVAGRRPPARVGEAIASGGELLPDPRGRGPAHRVARRERPGDGQDRAHVRREVLADPREVVVG